MSYRKEYSVNISRGNRREGGYVSQVRDSLNADAEPVEEGKSVNAEEAQQDALNFILEDEGIAIEWGFRGIPRRRGNRSPFIALLVILASALTFGSQANAEEVHLLSCEELASEIAFLDADLIKVFNIESWQQREAKLVAYDVKNCKRQFENRNARLSKCDEDFKAGRISNLKYCKWTADDAVFPNCERWLESGKSEKQITEAWTQDIPQPYGTERIQLCFGSARFAHLDGVRRLRFYIDRDPDDERFYGYETAD